VSVCMTGGSGGDECVDGTGGAESGMVVGKLIDWSKITSLLLRTLPYVPFELSSMTKYVRDSVDV
jgi:hypothetical protein